MAGDLRNSPQDHFIITLIITNRHDIRSKWPLARNAGQELVAPPHQHWRSKWLHGPGCQQYTRQKDVVCTLTRTGLCCQQTHQEASSSSVQPLISLYSKCIQSVTELFLETFLVQGALSKFVDTYNLTNSEDVVCFQLCQEGRRRL